MLLSAVTKVNCDHTHSGAGHPVSGQLPNHQHWVQPASA